MNIREKLVEQDWCGAELKVLQEELDQVMGGGGTVATAAEHAVPNPQIPTEPGGWWHQYVCPEHHTELLFNPLEEDAHSYRCPYGCKVEGEAYRGAWLVYRHQAWARYALQAAVVHAGTGDRIYAELGRQIIVRYARQYPHYPVHPDAQPWMLKGRAFHQALTEAIWATTLLRAYVLLREEGVSFEQDREALDIFLQLLESSQREYHGILVHKRGEPENNYTAWLIAALASIYAARGEHDELVNLIAAEGGFQNHLDLAIRSDQLEFEGSVYYHVFVLRAYFITAEMAERCGIGVWDVTGKDGQTLQGMCDVLVWLADGNGRLAALHDGPYDRVPYAREIAEVLEIGLARYGNEAYEPLLAEAYRQLSGESQRSGLEAVLYGNGSRELKTVLPCPMSGLLPDSGWAMLSHPDNALSALVDYGPHGGSHGHYDKLNLMLGHRGAPIAPDRGTVPYGSPLKKGWYPHTACHNTVTVGGRSQSEAAGSCRKLEITQESAYAWLETTEAYPGSRLARHVMVTADWVLDWFEVELDTEDEIDWWFHYVGEAVEIAEATHSGGRMARSIEWQQHEGALGTEDGYAYIRPTYSLLSDGIPLTLRIETPANPDQETGLIVAARMEPVCLQWLPTAGTEILRVQSPGLATDPSREMEGILMRCRGTKARFVAVYSAGEACPHVQVDEAGRVGIKQGGNLRTYQMTRDGLMEEGAS